MHYDMTSRVRLSFGLEAIHYSNGNTSWPNAGVNSLGASVGVACLLGSDKTSEEVEAPAWLEEEADRGRWFYDLIAFGAWRKRIVNGISCKGCINNLVYGSAVRNRTATT